MAQEALRDLPPERWGRQMKRAREDEAKLTMVEAVDRIGAYMLTSTGAMSRLEKLIEEPTGKRRRALAFVACVVYGIDPKGLGLTSADLPEQVALALRTLDAQVPRCNERPLAA